MLIRLLSAADVRQALPMSEAIAAMRVAFAEMAAGTARVPLRTSLSTGRGVTLFMPGYLAGSNSLAQKVVSVYAGNAERGLPVINGVVLVLDSETGVPRAILDGGTLTAIRTGAAAGLATDLLARPDCRVLALFGAGGQAYDQVQAVLAVRPIRQVRILSRSGRSCQALARRLREEGIDAISMRDPATAIRDADIISCATPATEPLFADADVPDGAHINLVGAFTPQMQEAPPETVARARVIVDDVEAALEEAGDLLKPLGAGLIDREHFSTTLGDLLAGRAPGRQSDQEITLFKSVGLAAQDVAAAAQALQIAETRDLGVLVEL
ncbi:MAG: ornithine cyclodeaminase [Caldilineae bacterium]|nr:MAG: ornithine cyclodeaminase [Caldilineae bacterium]